MKNFYPLWLLLGSLFFPFSQLSAQAITFQKTYGGTGNEVGHHVIVAEDGYVIAGQTTSPVTGDLDAYLLRVDVHGNVLWQNTYGGNSEDAFTLVTQASDGGFLAMGETRSAGAGGKDVFVVKVTADGFVEWSKTFGGGNDEVSPIQAKIVNLPNGYLISGYQNNGGGVSSIFVRLSNTGAVIWQHSYTGDANFLVGNYVTGDTIYAAGSLNNDGCFAKIDANTGNILSLTVFPQPFNDALYNVRPTQDGNLLLSDGTWTPANGTQQRQWLLKTTPDGTVLWSKTYGKSGINLRGVANNVSDGGFILAPYTGGFDAASDANLVKVDSNGAIRWAYSYGGPSDDHFINAIQTSDGGFIAIGATYNPESGEDNILLVKTDANGLVEGCSPRLLNLSVEDFSATPTLRNLTPDFFAEGAEWDVPMQLGLLTPAEYCRPPQITLDTTIALCPNQSIFIAHDFYTAPAVVQDTLSSEGNPDTIVVYTLVLAAQPSVTDTFFLCPGESITINGVVYTQPATISDTLASTTGGCDTLATYVILEGVVPTFDQTILFHAGDSVTLNGIIYTQPDTILAFIPATVGCDTLAIYYLQFTVDTLNGIVNSYTPITAFHCDSILLQVDSTTEFSVGDKVLIIQMQGATVDLSNTGNFGTVSDLGSAGNYEFNRIQSITGNDIQLKFALTKSYDVTGKVQLVRVPEYTDVTVGNLTCKPWDGTTGGVLAIDVANTLTLANDIDVSSKGFRGGAVADGSTSFYHETQFFYPPNPDLAAAKGEGIAIIPTEQSYGRGRAANGGGGGNAHNAGGGGGANAGNGGNGGQEFYTIPSSPTPGTQGIGAAKAVENSLDRIIMGGGGGAGHANDLVGSSGGNGGGIIIIKAKTIATNNQTHTLHAAGEEVFGPGGNAVNDGQGGGGAGGTILLDVDSLNGSLFCNAAGGRGGDCLYFGELDIIGPGGGGGGGKILTANSLSNLSFNLDGGAHGVANQNLANESQDGESGGMLVGLTFSVDSLPPTASINVEIAAPTCARLGQITILNEANALFSLNNGPAQSSPIFNNLAPGQYLITVQDSVYGCTKDSTITLIRQDSLLKITNYVSFCSNDTIVLGGVAYTQSDTVTIVLPATTGCDTLVTYILQATPQPTFTTVISFCPGDLVSIDGVTYTQPATVLSVIPATTGCDTLETYILEFAPQPTITKTLSFCPGKSVNIDGINYTQPGIVSGIIPAITGCDTLATYMLEFAPQLTITDTFYLCPGESITINDVVYTEPATILDTLPSATGGCDTLATYVILEAITPTFEQTISFCVGDSVSINGNFYSQSDTVLAFIPATIGCDTLAIYYLQMVPQPTITKTLSFCPGESVTINGVIYTQPGTVAGIIPATTGCDTLATYVLQFLPNPTITKTISFCPGESVSIDGVTYTQPGTVAGVIPAAVGCDTLATYILQFLPNPTITKTIRFCPGESVNIDGVTYTQPGTVSGVIPATTGCDTLATYILQFLPQPSFSQTIEFCKGDSVMIGGTNYTQPAIVTLLLPSSTGGCDTIATYTLQYLVPNHPTAITLTCPANISVATEPGENSIQVAYNLPAATSDCPCPGIDLRLQQGLASASSFPVGLTTVCYSGQDSCGNASTCCFNVAVQATSSCDVKVIGCMRYELLEVTEDTLQRKTYRIRAVNNCTSRLAYLAIQLPNGVIADLPANNSVYTAPSSRTYMVRNPNYTPFYSLRYSPLSAGIQTGQSDVFKYTLPANSAPNYIHVLARLESQEFYEAYLNTFFCTGSNEPRAAQLEDNAIEGTFSVFPNPTDGRLFADLSTWMGQKMQVRIFSAQGRLMQSAQVLAEGQAQVVDLPSTLADGLYLLEVTPAQGKPQIQKFILAH